MWLTINIMANRLLLAEADGSLRDVLTIGIDREPKWEVVHSIANADDALGAVRGNPELDAVILDFEVPFSRGHALSNEDRFGGTLRTAQLIGGMRPELPVACLLYDLNLVQRALASMRVETAELLDKGAPEGVLTVVREFLGEAALSAPSKAA